MHRRQDRICVETAWIYYLDESISGKPESTIGRLGHSRIIHITSVGVCAIQCIESLDMELTLWCLLPGCYISGRYLQKATMRVEPQRTIIIKDGSVDRGTRQPVPGIQNT